MKKTAPSFSLKDQLFNPKKVAYLANLIGDVHPGFAKDPFCQNVLSAFPRLELKERIAHITEELHVSLPGDYSSALDILLRALPPELDPTRRDDDFGDFIIAPFSHFVAHYGCSRDHLDRSLDALRTITKRFSAEDAIRYFINAFPGESMAFLANCARDDNYHVRRLASEGTRPKLPWSQKLVIPHAEPLPILDKLFADPARFVTRSVANHLNDISKLDPDLVVSTLKRWRKSQDQDEKEMGFIVRHALRTLVKKGHGEALDLLGFGGKPDITVGDFTTSTPQVRIGESFEFSLEILSNKKQQLVVDYLMHFASDGKKAGRKVFKLKQLSLDKGEVVTLRKKHPMRLMTTRRLVAGEHQIQLQVNGQPFGSVQFELLEV